MGLLQVVARLFGEERDTETFREMGVMGDHVQRSVVIVAELLLLAHLVRRRGNEGF